MSSVQRRLNDGAGRYLFVRFALRDGQPIQQPPQLPLTDADRTLVGCVRPLKTSTFQSPIVDPETIVLPLQNLELVPPPITEREQTWRKWVQVEHFLNQCCQSIDRLAQVRISASEINRLIESHFA